MSKQVFYTVLLRSCYLTVAMILVWLGFNTVLDGSIWNGMTISNSALKVEYCEFNNTEQFFHQSMNTYSNLAYFFFGVFIVQMALNDYKNRGLNTLNRLEHFPLLSALMGVCFIYLSFGSAFFHASLTWVGQRMDMNGTYSITITLVGIGLYHVLHKMSFSNQMKNLWVIALLAVILLFIKIALLIPSGTLLPALILVSLVFTLIHYFQSPKKRFLILPILSLILMVIAVKIRTLDVQKVSCNPYSWYQGHSLWHLLTAMSSFCSYSFFRFTKSF